MKFKFSFLLFLCFFSLNTASACLCYTLFDFDEQIERSDFIFIGTVDTIFENYYETNKLVYLVQIEKYYKSKHFSYFTADAIFITGTSSCSKEFQQDSTYLIYANDIGYFNTVHMCSRSDFTSAPIAKQDISLLVKKFEPQIPKTKITKNIRKQIQDKTKADSINKNLQVLLDKSALENSSLERNNKISFGLMFLMLIFILYIFLRPSSKN
jgi:hypothetical protein